MERIPILRMGEFLLVTIQVDMHDQLAMTLQDDLAERISSTSAKAVLIDISALDMVDSFIGRMISSISGLSSIMDAETVVVGMQPAVAITLVELEFEDAGEAEIFFLPVKPGSYPFYCKGLENKGMEGRFVVK